MQQKKKKRKENLKKMIKNLQGWSTMSYNVMHI